MFSLAFSEESSIVAEQKERITQLEQQIETQNKIIARYERLEDKIDSRMSQSLSLDREVKEAHKENLNEIDGRFQSKINWILALVSFAFGIVALISITPIYQSLVSKKVLERLKAQEKNLKDQEEKLKLSLEKIIKQEKLSKEDRFNNLSEMKLVFAKTYKEEAKKGSWAPSHRYVIGILEALNFYFEVNKSYTSTKLGIILCELMDTLMFSEKNPKGMIIGNIWGNLDNYKNVRKIFENKELFKKAVKCGPLEITHHVRLDGSIEELFEKSR